MANYLEKLLAHLTDPRTARTFLKICAVIAVMGFIASMEICSTQRADIRDLNDIIAMQNDTIDFQDEVITAQDALINVHGSTIESYERDIAAKDADIEGLSQSIASLMAQNTDLQAALASANRQFELLQGAVPINVILDVGNAKYGDDDIIEWTFFGHPNPEADLSMNHHTLVSGINSVKLYSPFVELTHVEFRNEVYTPDINGIVELPLSEEEVGQLYFNDVVKLHINVAGKPLTIVYLNIDIKAGAV